jgi:hypothetical protein
MSHKIKKWKAKFDSPIVTKASTLRQKVARVLWQPPYSQLQQNSFITFIYNVINKRIKYSIRYGIQCMKPYHVQINVWNHVILYDTSWSYQGYGNKYVEKQRLHSTTLYSTFSVSPSIGIPSWAIGSATSSDINW